jgi:hypothetical protein
MLGLNAAGAPPGPEAQPGRCTIRRRHPSWLQHPVGAAPLTCRCAAGSLGGAARGWPYTSTEGPLSPAFVGKTLCIPSAPASRCCETGASRRPDGPDGACTCCCCCCCGGCGCGGCGGCGARDAAPSGLKLRRAAISGAELATLTPSRPCSGPLSSGARLLGLWSSPPLVTSSCCCCCWCCQCGDAIVLSSRSCVEAAKYTPGRYWRPARGTPQRHVRRGSKALARPSPRPNTSIPVSARPHHPPSGHPTNQASHL